MAHFLYVFSKPECDTLLACGYRLITADEQRDIYVFENQESRYYSSDDVRAIQSDTLAF